MLTSILQQLAPASLGSGLMSQHQQAALLQAAAQGGPLPLLPLTTPTTSDPPLSSIDTIAPLQHTFQVHTKDGTDGVISCLTYCRPSPATQDSATPPPPRPPARPAPPCWLLGRGQLGTRARPPGRGRGRASS